MTRVSATVITASAVALIHIKNLAAVAANAAAAKIGCFLYILVGEGHSEINQVENSHLIMTATLVLAVVN